MARLNHEIIKEQPLLDEKGNISEPGWSRRQLQIYDRKQIKAPKFRIKEWDYYLVVGDDFAVAFTLSDDGYVGLQSVSLLNFKENWEHTETVLDAFPMGKFKLPTNSSQGNIVYDNGRLTLKYVLEEGMRHILCRLENFYKGKPFSCDICLQQPEMDAMVIATPWPKKGHFYYNQKINCMRASGWAEYDGVRYEFEPQRNFGTLVLGLGKL